ncbi:MAG: hypothetical protein AB7R77_11955 [Ilumatobacteraceae bacterium]
MADFTKSFDDLQEGLAPALEIVALLQQGLSGAGRPKGATRHVHLAVIVAAIGAWQTFVEALAEDVADVLRLTPEQKAWFSLSDPRRSKVQTPNSGNVRSLLFSLTGSDLVGDWQLSIVTSQVELGTGKSPWRSYGRRYIGTDAAIVLDEIVQIRHGYAHGDIASIGKSKTGNPKTPPAGVAVIGKNGKWNVQSHHAANAIATALQLAVHSEASVRKALVARGVAIEPPKFRKAMERQWNSVLARTPAAAEICSAWRVRKGVLTPPPP